jgi:group I intron endonuclease
MPYAIDYIGIYKIRNTVTGTCYVGQSQRVKKRVRDHFRLLHLKKHPNPRLQNSYLKYGSEAFDWSLEVKCVDTDDLDIIENAFISREAWFDEPVFFNIADFAKAPMRGKVHSVESRKKISEGRRNTTFNYKSDEYCNKLKVISTARHFANPEFVAKTKFIIENQDMSYAERGRVLGIDTSSVRKLALKYKHLRGEL